MIVLDSGVLIAYADASDAHHASVVEFLAERAETQFVVSALTLAEVLVRPAKSDRVGEALTGLMNLELDVEDVRQEDSVALAGVRASTSLKMPDALVVYTAQRLGAECATTDAQLASRAGEHGLVAHLLVD